MTRALSPLWILALGGVSLSIMTAASPANAGKRVVVLGLERHPARAAIVRILRAEHDLVSRRKVQTEARQLGIGTECDPALVPGLASVLGAEAVVCGAVRRGKLTLKVYNGGDGKVIRILRLRVGRSGIKARVRRKLARKLNPALAKSWNWAAEEVKKTKGANLSWEKEPPRDMTQEPMPERNVAAAPADPQTWENDDGENPLTQSARPTTKKKAAAVVRAAPQRPRRAEGAHAVRLGVGPAFLLRRNYGVYDAASLHDAQGWKTSPSAGITVGGEIFPAAWFTDNFAANIGIGLSYSRYFGLTWRTSNNPEEHSATHQALAADLRGRYLLPIGKRSLVIGGHFGYRLSSFAMNDDKGVRAVVPDVSFSSLDIGVGAEINVLPRWLTAAASFSYLPVLSQGEIVTGQEYGAGSGGGMVFGGALGGAIYGDFGWRLTAEYSRYTVSFKGDPSAARHAAKARDRYLTSTLMLTYVN